MGVALSNPPSRSRSESQDVCQEVRKPRVLFVINSLAGGGAERVMTTLLAQSEGKARNHDIALAVLDNDPRAFALPEWLNVIQLDCKAGTVSSISAVERVVRDYDPDVTLSFLTRSNIASGIAMMKRARPWIISERTSTSAHLGNGARQLVTKSLIRLVYPRASRLIAVSSGVASKLCASYAVDPRRIDVLPNPVDCEGLEAAACKKATISFDEPYVIAVGRLVAVKNYALLIRAFAKSGLTARLVIVGDGPEREKLESLATDLGISDRVIFPGWLSNPYPVLKRASVFALSSNVEGFPNALVEALALGIPVVATNCNDGPAEILEGTTTPSSASIEIAKAGILTPVGDVDLYAEALHHAFEFEDRAKVADAAKERSKAYSAPVIAASYWDIVEREIARSRVQAKG